MLLQYISNDGVAQAMFVFCATVIIVELLVHHWRDQ